MPRDHRLTLEPSVEERDAQAALVLGDDLQVRPSIRLSRAAKLIDCDISTLYRALRSGQLQGHRLNRSHRIYLDSLRAWQQAGQPEAPRPPEPGKRHNHASHRAAMERLRARGIVI